MIAALSKYASSCPFLSNVALAFTFQGVLVCKRPPLSGDETPASLLVSSLALGALSWKNPEFVTEPRKQVGIHCKSGLHVTDGSALACPCLVPACSTSYSTSKFSYSFPFLCAQGFGQHER